MTDGRSQDRVLFPSRILRKLGVEMFAVGIGRRYSMSQLIQLASDRGHVLTASFRNLNSLVSLIKARACKGKKPIPHRPSGTLRAIGLYPLNALLKARDISFRRNPPGRLSNVKAAPGPDGHQGTSYQFYGRSNSYITLPNNGKLDAKRSITILVHIFHLGHSGPIVHYYARGWGVHLWIKKKRLFARFTRRRRNSFTQSLSSAAVKPNTWQFVGASYDHRTGVAKLFLRGRVIARRRIGRIRLATQHPIRVGAKIGDGRYFKGKISCIQIYNVALTARQIAARERRCSMTHNIRPGPRPRPRPALPVCVTKLDLGLLVDGSGSVGKGNFDRCIKFIQSLVSSFKISRLYTRVGLVVYSSRPKPIFKFGRFNNKYSLIRALGRVRYPRGGTKTGYALRFIERYLFASSRKNRALIVMTDGRSFDKVSYPARALKRMGVNIFGVGLGKRYNSRQLNHMASNRRNVFTASFRNLGYLVRALKQKACRASTGRPVRPRPGGRVCKTKVNLGFLVDGSGSIEYYGRGNFRRCLNFIQNVVHAFNIGRHSTKVGVVLFSSRPYKVFGFNRYSRKAAVLNAIGRISYPRRGTRTGKALSFTRRYLFKNTGGRRNVLIVMTDGRSQDRVSGPANALRRAGIRCLALGIGRHYNIHQLKQIASSPSDVFTAGFRNLISVVRVIKKKACGTSGQGPSGPGRPHPGKPYGRKFYRWVGCFKDRRRRAIKRMIANYRGHRKAIVKCAQLARRRGYKVFALQYGGQCFSGPRAHLGYNRYGLSTKCHRGRGGSYANDVYRVRWRRPIRNNKWHYWSRGCYGGKPAGYKMADLRRVPHAVRKCARLARKRGYKVFALRKRGICYSGPRAHLAYRNHRKLLGCGKRRGGPRFNSVYVIRRGRAPSKHSLYLRRKQERLRRLYRLKMRRLKMQKHHRLRLLRLRRRQGRLRRLRLLKLRRRRTRLRRLRLLRLLRRQGRLRRLQLLKLRRRRARMRRLRLLRLRRRQGRLRRLRLLKLRRRRARLRRLRLLRLRRRQGRLRRIRLLKLRRRRARLRRLRLKRRRRHQARLRRLRLLKLRRRQARLRRLRLKRRRRHQAKLRRLRMRKLRRRRARRRKLRMQRRRRRRTRKRWGRRRRRRQRRRRRRRGRGRRRGRRRRRRRRRRGKKRGVVVHPKEKDRLKDIKKTPLPDFYWSFNIKLAQPTHDLIQNQGADLQDGANIGISPGKGSVAETKSTKNASISLGDFKGRCFSDPDTCKGKGVTVMTSIKIDTSTLSSNSSSYVMSTGGQTTKARGFALVHTKNQYVLILGTKTKQWILKTPSLPADWFNLAFTWQNGDQLKLFVNGKIVASSKPLPVTRLQDMFTSFTIGRPNNSHTLKYKLGLEVDDVALWETALTDQQILSAFKSGVHLPRNQSKVAPKAKPWIS